MAVVTKVRVAAGEAEADECWPALKAATLNIFTAAAAEAGEGDDGGEEGSVKPTCEAAAADQLDTFTAEAAKVGTGTQDVAAVKIGGGAEGLEMVSAITLLTPATWRMSKVYSATFDS